MDSEKIFQFLKDRGIIKGYSNYYDWCESKGIPVPSPFQIWFKGLSEKDKYDFQYMFGKVDI